MSCRGLYHVKFEFKNGQEGKTETPVVDETVVAEEGLFWTQHSSEIIQGVADGEYFKGNIQNKQLIYLIKETSPDKSLLCQSCQVQW